MNALPYFLIVVLLLAGGCAPATSQEPSALSRPEVSVKELDRQLDNLTEQIISNLTVNKYAKVAVVEFSDLDGKVSPLGKYLAEELTTRLFRAGKFEIIERKLLAKMLEEQKLNVSGLIDENTAQKIGMTLGVDAITTGTVSDLNTSIKINARLIAPQTGVVFAVASATVPVDKEIAILLHKKGRILRTGDPGRFDGTWNVAIVCPLHTDGALGYTHKFQARVQDGVLRGQRGLEGSPGFLTLSGRINPDGSALLEAYGLTGDPKFAVDRAKDGTPYSFHVTASFEGTHGTGSRVEARVCTLTFDRQ